MSHKGKTNTNQMIKGKNLFKGNVPKAKIEVSVDKEGLVTKRKVDHMRKGYVYNPTKGFKKTWDYPQSILMNSLLLRFGIVPM